MSIQKDAVNAFLSNNFVSPSIDKFIQSLEPNKSLNPSSNTDDKEFANILYTKGLEIFRPWESKIRTIIPTNRWENINSQNIEDINKLNSNLKNFLAMYLKNPIYYKITTKQNIVDLMNALYEINNQTSAAEYMSNLYILNVWPILESIAKSIDPHVKIEPPQKTVTKFMDMLYSQEGLNDNLKRYLSDLGVTDIPEEYLKNWKPSTDFTKDLYLLYKMIIRNTLLSKFRSINHDLLGDQNLEIHQMESMINNLVFINISEIIDPVYYGFDSLSKVMSDSKLLLINDKSLMFTAINNKENYLKFLKHVALDSNKEHSPQVSLEYLLKTLTTLPIDPSNPVILFVSQYLYNNMAIVMNLFQLLHKYQSKFNTENAMESSKILTFIKIRNDDPYGRFNERFQITTDSLLNSMLIKYTNNEQAIYPQSVKDEIHKRIKLENGLACSKKGGAILQVLKNFKKPEPIEDIGGGAVKNKKGFQTPPTSLKESRNYIFGPFTKIFIPDQNAQAIANSEVIRSTIIKKLDSGKDICIFGYGQSGGGKTSLLIYYKQCANDAGEMGIMSRICDQTKYTNMTIRIKEVGESAINDNEFYKSKKFIKNGQNWELQSPISELKSQDGSTVNPEVLKTLGGYVFFVTENMRLTKGTTNNPISSRTHIFVFIKFEDGPTLIIGDFAGVENVFDCKNSKVLNQMSNIINPVTEQFAYQNLLDSKYNEIFGTLGLFDNKPYSEIYKTLNFEFKDLNSDLSNKIKKLASLANDKRSEIIKLNNVRNFYLKNNLQIKEKLKNNYSKNAFVAQDERKKILNSLSAIGELFNITHDYQPFPDSGLTERRIQGFGQDLDKLFEKNGWYDFYLFQLIQAEKQNFMSSECQLRVKEGNYINKSLKEFRKFLGYILKKSGAVPQTLGYCDTLQCNPFYEDCYGSLFSNDDKSGGLIEECIQSELTTSIENLTFCIFNVINISQDKNDPPPVPFIDSNDLTFGYNSYKSGFMKPETLITILANLIERLNSFKTMDSITRNNIISNINQILELGIKGVELIPSHVIEQLENYNASTFLGTMIFSDSIAKFGTNKVLCEIPNSIVGDEKQLFSNISQIKELVLNTFTNPIDKPRGRTS